MARPKNYVAMVLDSSGSMDSVHHEAVAAFNNAVETIRNEAKDQDTSVSLILFANRAHTQFFNADPATLKPLGLHDYRPSGGTALFDGVGRAIEVFQGVPDGHLDHVSFLIITVTDGEENASQRHSGGTIAALIKEQQKTDRWSFVFQVPPGKRKWFTDRFGISTDNIREWESTREGTVEADVATRSGLGHYFNARRKGARSVPNFFVNTDLSQVPVEEIKAKLADQSDRFKLYEVKTEENVKEFVEKKTKKPYVIGQAYYLLMKTEKVQARKGVLLMEKGKQAVWGGPNARKLIGLPDGADAKVVPGNHAGYDIYVQSTSVNRKLPRGTKVLIDLKMDKDLVPTWDHTAVEKK